MTPILNSVLNFQSSSHHVCFLVVLANSSVGHGVALPVLTFPKVRGVRRARQLLRIGSPGSILKRLHLLFVHFLPSSLPLCSRSFLEKIADQLLESKTDGLLKRHRSPVVRWLIWGVPCHRPSLVTRKAHSCRVTSHIVLSQAALEQQEPQHRGSVCCHV